MAQEHPPEELPIDEEAEAAARADLERQFQESIPRFSEQALIAAYLAEAMGGAPGLDPSKVPADLANRMQMLHERLRKLSSEEPPPLEESRVPPTWIAPAEEQEGRDRNA
jgi:hypothetical protein